MNSKQSLSSLLTVAFLLFLSVSCKQPKGREWDNAYPDQAGRLDVDGPPQVRAEQKWLDRRTAPEPVDKAESKETESQQEGAKKEKVKHDGVHKK